MSRNLFRIVMLTSLFPPAFIVEYRRPAHSQRERAEVRSLKCDLDHTVRDENRQARRLAVDYPPAVHVGFAMPSLMPPRIYRFEASRFREMARTATGALKQEFQKLAALY
jgi:hypothetical protein